MPTPGSTVESQTPMIPLERRMERAYDRLLQRSEENAKLEISRGADARQFGRIILQFERLNNNMTVMQAEIRRDIRARRKYFEEEKKLLKKDSDNLDSIRAGSLFTLRRDLGIFAGVSGLLAARDGDTGTATSNFGVAIGSFLPEIATGVAALLGLGVGGRGGGRTPGVTGGTPRAGGGKWGWALPIAALAATLLMGGAQQANADQRRSGLTQTQVNTPILNRSDTERFRGQLNRFERILIAMGSGLDPETGQQRGKKGVAQDAINEQLGGADVQMPNMEVDSAAAVKEEEDRSRGTTTVVGDETSQQIIIPPEEEKVSSANTGEEEINRFNKMFSSELIGLEQDVLIASSSLDGMRISMGDTRRKEFISETNNLQALSGAFNNYESIGNKFEPEDLSGGFDLIDPGDKEVEVPDIKRKPFRWPWQKDKSGTTNIITTDNQGQQKVLPPPPTGQGATGSPWVATKYVNSGGAFDKFDYAVSLKTYAAFT